MPFPEGMVFFVIRLARPVLERFIQAMQVSRLISAGLCLLPSVLLAHPGHHHPDETDEFDFFKATFFHSHGALDWILAAVALAALGVALFAGKPALRLGALAVMIGALAAL